MPKRESAASSRSRSSDPAMRSQELRRSSSPSRASRGRSSSPKRKSIASTRSRSTDPATRASRGRSASPKRKSIASTRSRSTDLATRASRGRSASPKRKSIASTRSRSTDLATRASRGRSASPKRKSIASTRSRSTDPALQNQERGRSSSPPRASRGRSASPARMRGRSSSPGSKRRESRSVSAERQGGTKKGRFPIIRRGGKRKHSKASKTEGEEGKHRRRGALHKGRKVLAKAPKAIAKAPKRLGKGIVRGGKGIAKAPRRLKKRVKRGGVYIKQRIAPNQECPMWKVLCYVVPIVVIIGCAIGLISATGSKDKFTPTFVSNLIPKLDGKDVVDPFAGGGSGRTTSVAKWDNGDDTGGLNVTVLNAMASDWDKFFDLVISDYDFGVPDALTLSTEKVEEDKDCTPVEGKIKICNGDYGETKWRGINGQTFDTAGFVAASTAKMNEFYLQYDVDDAKQYTLCHEMGHSFGLAHTDENFDNEDLGNCMDYTDNYEANKHPDDSNYESLAALYGTVGTRLRGLLRSRTTGTSTDVHNTNTNQGRGFLEPTAWNKIHEAVERLAARLDDNAHEDGWKLLHRSIHGEAHELEFEEGYKVRVHMLLAKSN